MKRMQPLLLTSPVWDDGAWAEWCEYLSSVEQRVYVGLRRLALIGHTEVDLVTFAKNEGVSGAALERALRRLESVGLLEDVSDA